MIKIPHKICLAMILGLRMGSYSYANEPVSSDGWSFTLAPYIWAASARGDVGLASTGTHFVESSFSHIVKKVDLSLMLMGVARKGPYSVLFDLMYVDGSIKHNFPVGYPATRIKAKAKVAMGFLGAGYEVFDNDALRVDAVAGIRGWHVDGHIGLHGRYLDGVSGSISKTWVDVTAGLRGRYKINEEFSIAGWGLAGGGQAKSDWDLALLANWDVTKDVTLTAGYRAVGVNYRRNGFVYDITQKGPMIGLSIKF